MTNYTGYNSSSRTDFDWDTLSLLLKSEHPKCALILGEGAFFCEDDELLVTKYEKFLKKKMPGYLASESSKAEFLIFPNNERPSIVTQIQNFYTKQTPDELLLRLAQIPFPLIINMTNHCQIHKAFKKMKISFTDDLFNRNKDNIKSLKDKPSSAKPLIYNFVGSIDERERDSLILSYDELFNYLDKSFKGDSISNKRDLNELIHSIDYFVFLGVPFDCWYLHMFLHFLGIHELKGRSYHAAVKNRDTKNDMYTYCNDAFKIQFVNKDIKEFVDYVYNHSDISSILRKDTDGPLSGLEKAEEEALQCRFNSCLDLLKSFLDSNCTDNEELIRQYKLIKAEYEVLNSEYMIKKTIGDPYEMGIARIKDILLKLIDKCKDCIKKNSNDGNE